MPRSCRWNRWNRRGCRNHVLRAGRLATSVRLNLSRGSGQKYARAKAIFTHVTAASHTTRDDISGEGAPFSVVDPASAEDLGPQEVPDPPRKPFPPC